MIAKEKTELSVQEPDMVHPSYKNLEKPSPDEIVIRYTSLAQFIWIVTQRKLPLIRVDSFPDPFEGSAPRSSIEEQLMLSGSGTMIVQPPAARGAQMMWEAREARITARRRNRTYSTHVSCWRWGPESDGMWRLYCGEKEGVALQTTFARLEQSVGTELLAGKIRYGDYETMLSFTEELDHVMYKREGFVSEQEVRLLRTDDDHCNKLCNGTASREELPRCLSIPWDIKAAVDRILVSPYAKDWYLEAVRAAARLGAARLADEELGGRVEWSKLRKPPEF